MRISNGIKIYLKTVWRRAGESPVLAFLLLVRSTARLLILSMRTSRKEKKSVVHSKVRSLTIQPRFRESVFASKHVPEIRLCGEWLKKLGFVQGRKVIITTMNELLIVRLESENKLANEIS